LIRFLLPIYQLVHKNKIDTGVFPVCFTCARYVNFSCW